ncbi:hypothetical protein C8J56DRAFT_786443 [Mycena floridula]|nr:hypothetical protein C8J56DRAFT_786443 [Mycena floridula]
MEFTGPNLDSQSKSDDGLQIDNIKIVFHPSSGEKTKISHFHEYDINGYPEPPLPDRPWTPFRNRLDFEVAELALLCWMDKSKTARLISLFERASAGREEFTIKSESELQKLWDLVGKRKANFKNSVVRVKYNKEDREYNLLHRDLWDWSMDLVKDPRLAYAFHWDACRLYKYNGDQFVRFLDEPWTADNFWDIQSKLPPGAKPLLFIFYADKNKLSTFGTEKGYPVVARLGNLLGDVRNGAGIGKGEVVGWLPVVAEEASEAGKQKMANLKSIVWHESIDLLFIKIAEYSESGNFVQCGDALLRQLFPFVGIISADCEEMFIVNLVRGTASRHPYYKCLVPREELCDLSKSFIPRTVEDTFQVLQQVDKLKLKGEKEDLLKEYSICPPLQNAFARVANTDPHAASSFDELHTDDSGLWGKHLFSQFKLHIDALGQSAATEIDNRVNSFPRWRNLNHFSAITTLSFNDGNKHFDISKIFLYVAQSVITREKDEAGYQLLKALRAYMNETMYTRLSLQTTDTIQYGRQEILNFGKLIEEYDTMTANTDFQKSWNFPKFHLRQHAFDDIMQKGTIRHLSTRTSEKLHGPLRKIYHEQTNFKDVGAQILKIEHRLAVALSIREDLGAIDDAASKRLQLLLEEFDDENVSPHPEDKEDIFERVTIGSKDKRISFAELEELRSSDAAFSRLHIRLGEFFTKVFQALSIPLPQNRAVQISKHDTIIPFKFMSVAFQSTVNWKLADNYLRCHPNFHGRARYDFVLVKTLGTPFFGELVYMFSSIVDEKSYHLALIWPYEVVKHRSHKDRDLGLLRVRRQAGVASEIISVDTVIRGAVAVSTAP